MRAEEEVHAAVGLEGTEVQVVMESVDRRDPDHVPEWLDHLEIRVRPFLDPARVAELHAGEREGSRRLADPCRAVEEERVRAVVGERRRQQALRLELLGNVCERIVAQCTSPTAAAILSARSSAASVPSSTT